MFNYTHEVIINGNVGSQTGGKRIGTYTDTALGVKHLMIERGGDYRADLVFPRGEGVVFKTNPVDASNAKLVIAAPSNLTAGTVFQFSVFVKLLDPAALSEYAYPNWASFGKPIVVGFTYKSDFAAELVAALKDAIPYNNKFISVKKNGTAVELEGSMYSLDFDGYKLEKLVEGECDGCEFDKYVIVETTFNRTAPVSPFGTAEYLVENYRFPSYGNTRYAALNSDETPIPGVKYTMYSFSYDSPRPGFGGISGVGQKVDAVTRHIYWVADSVVDDFDAALTAAGISVSEK